MPDAKIEILGLTELVAAIGQLQGMAVARDAMEEAVERVRTQIAVYPPPLPRQIYVRTGTLGRRWTTKLTQAGDIITGEVGNKTVYGPFVQSEEGQRRPFKGRWRTDVQVATMMASSIQALFEARLQAAMP